MTEKELWGNTPQHTIDFANKRCAENGARMAKESKGDSGEAIHIVFDENTPGIPKDALYDAYKRLEEKP